MLDLADRMLADQMAGQHAFGIADAILCQLLPPAPLPATAPAEPAAAGFNPPADPVAFSD